MNPLRVGVALLASDLILEPEMQRALPPEVAAYVARVPYPERVTDTSLLQATQNLESAIETLRGVRPELLVWACTSGSFFRGREFNEELERRISAAGAGARAITASSAVVAALRELDAQRVAVLTPYSAEINQRLDDFLQASGFDVVSMHQLYEDPDLDDFELQSIAPQALIDACRRAAHSDADALVVSCTGVPLLQVVERVEAELGQPVIGSNLSIIRSMLRASDRRQGLEGMGQLLGRAIPGD